MKKTIAIVAFLTKTILAYPQIHLGLELGANSTFGTKKIRNEHFELCPLLDFSPLNIGGFISLTKNKNQFILGYRGNQIDGTYRVRQYDSPNISADISYEYIAHRFYLGYWHKWKGVGFGGNLSFYQYSNYGIIFSNTDIDYIVPANWTLTTDYDAAPKRHFIPALEFSYDIKIKKKILIIASLEVPLWRFSGHDISYGNNNLVNNQYLTMNFKPGFYATFLNLRMPIFTIGSGWNYFSKNPKRTTKYYNSRKCPVL